MSEYFVRTKGNNYGGGNSMIDEYFKDLIFISIACTQQVNNSTDFRPAC